MAGGFSMIRLGIKYIFSGQNGRKEIEKWLFRALTVRVFAMAKKDKTECLNYLEKVKTWKLETLIN